MAPPNLELLAHYIIARTEPGTLGATKLNKVLWFVDLEHYRRHGRSITGLTAYVRLERGPVPPGIERVLSSLKASQKIFERKTKVFSHVRREFVWLKEPDVSNFTSEQIDILNEVIDAVCAHTAGSVSDVTHDALWQEINNGDDMSIAAGSIITRAPTEDEMNWASSQKIAENV